MSYDAEMIIFNRKSPPGRVAINLTNNEASIRQGVSMVKMEVIMPLDHYVSQVHLKNFYSPKLQCLMYAIRKNDLKFFKTNSDSVCRIDNGSTNL